MAPSIKTYQAGSPPGPTLDKPQPRHPPRAALNISLLGLKSQPTNLTNADLAKVEKEPLKIVL